MSEGIRLVGLLARLILDNIRKTLKELGPSGLSLGEELGGGEVFKVMVVGDDTDLSRKTFQVMSPCL